MFFVIALSIWTAMNAYVIWRIATLPPIAKRVPRRIFIVAGVALASSYLVARVVESRGANGIAVALEWIGAQWMGVVMIALGCFFIADVLTGFGRLLPRQAPAMRTAAFAVSIVLTLIAVANAMRAPVVREYEVKIASLPPERDGLVIVAISDLHLGTLTGERWLAARIAQVEALRPDLIAVIGDLTEGDAPAESELPRVLARLRAPLGVWAVPGNHESHGENPDALLQRAGIRVLRDASAEVAHGLYIAGVDTAGHTHVPGRGIVEKALAAVPHGSATILLSHYPEQVEKAARGGASLMIAAHTHGGQIWPFGLFVRLMYRYLGGRYDVDGMPLIVCRGTGTWGPRMRLWYPNEILRITLHRR